MKKLFLGLLITMSALYASGGEEIYKAKCAMCHANKGMMSKQEMQNMRTKMQNATQEERMAMREQMMRKMKKSDMKAPPMPMVSSFTRKRFLYADGLQAIWHNASNWKNFE